MESVTQLGVESLYQNIGLEMPYLAGPVEGTAEAVRFLRFQSVGQTNQHPFASYSRYMQIFVVSLRRAESGGPGQTSLYTVAWLVKQVDTRTENRVVYQVVFIQTGACQEYKLSKFPFVLYKTSGYAYVLFHIPLVARHDVVQRIILVFQSGSERGRSKKYPVEVAHIHSSGYPRQVVRFTVSVRVVLCSVITVAVGMLHRAVERKLMLVFLPE